MFLLCHSYYFPILRANIHKIKLLVSNARREAYPKSFCFTEHILFSSITSCIFPFSKFIIEHLCILKKIITQTTRSTD